MSRSVDIYKYIEQIFWSWSSIYFHVFVICSLYHSVREAAKKDYFFSGPATKRRGGDKGFGTKKMNFFEARKIFVANKLEGVGALVTMSTKKKLRLPLGNNA